MKAALTMLTFLATMCVADEIVTKSGVLNGLVKSVEAPFVAVVQDDAVLRVVKLDSILAVRTTSAARAESLSILLSGIDVVYRPTSKSGIQPASPTSAEQAPPAQTAPNLRPSAIYEAGRKLRQARTLHFTSIGLGVVGSTVSLALAVYQFENPDVRMSKWIREGIPLAIDLGSLVTAYLAWHRIGEAGDDLQLAAPASIR